MKGRRSTFLSKFIPLRLLPHLFFRNKETKRNLVYYMHEKGLVLGWDGSGVCVCVCVCVRVPNTLTRQDFECKNFAFVQILINLQAPVSAHHASSS